MLGNGIACDGLIDSADSISGLLFIRTEKISKELILLEEIRGNFEGIGEVTITA